jgi:ubiquinone/menaquinone biosynthesis C-methylase UbiE
MATEPTHFDRRGVTYDRDEVHQRITSLLMKGLELQPGFAVLDIATGTGIAALQAAPQVGSNGRVIGIDVSAGMLSEAQHKAAAAGLNNIQFMQGDAEQVGFRSASFDCIVCASALVLMSNIPRALRHWATFLKTGGVLAFDTPAKPFGLSQRAVEIAARHGIHLSYGEAADTPDKCRALIKAAALEVLDVRTELANTTPMSMQDAIAFWDQRIDHPAWKPIKEATSSVRRTMRSDFVRSIEADAVNGYVPNDTALNFSYARQPIQLSE